MPCKGGGWVCIISLAMGLLIFIKRVWIDVNYPHQQLHSPLTAHLLFINDQDVRQESYF